MTALDDAMMFRSQKAVVVIEEDSYLQSLIAAHLEKAGYLVHVARTAVDARLQISAVKPDAVVIDVDLGPGAAGLEIARTLKSRADEIGLVCLTNALDPRFVGFDTMTSFSRTAYVQKHLLGDSLALMVAVNSVVAKRHLGDERLSANFRQNREQLSTPQIHALQGLSEGPTRRQVAQSRRGMKSFWAIRKA